MRSAAAREDTIVLPRMLRFPLEMITTPEFDPQRLETWPQVAGRLEYVDGRLLYMPPCADEQQDTVADVVIAIGSWVRAHPQFVLGTNEAGMHLEGSTRAADAAVWRRADLGARTGGLRRYPPVLAVEVAGGDDSEEALREKAAWYLRVGVRVVWLVLPQSHEVLVLTHLGEKRYHSNERLLEHNELPGLAPVTQDFFIQLSEP